MQPLTPLYQGQIDVFCAIYAALNGLRLTHGIRLLTARDIFHNTLLELGADRDAFVNVLEQRTDYQELVDGLLSEQAFNWPMRIRRPYPCAKDNDNSMCGHTPDVETVWSCLCQWFALSAHHVALFRFVRYLIPDGRPIVHHWTCANTIDDSILQLFDSSRDQGAISVIHQHELVTRAEDGGNGKVYIQPHTIRLICPL